MSQAEEYRKIFTPVEAKAKSIVYAQTWGHLAPEKNTTYRSQLLFAVSEYNTFGVCLIKEDLPNSPWMFDAINDWLGSFSELEPGFYKVNVTFRNFRFWGKPLKIEIE